TDFDHLHTRFRLNPSEIHLNPVLVRKSFNESASGSYSQHFPSSRFSLNAFGSIFPGSLDALLGQWWERIFLPVHTPDPLQGDVSVWGQWPDRDSLQSVTAVSGSGASYRGMAIPDLRLKIRSNREWAYLDELNARFLDGRVSGRLGWRLGLGKGQLRPMIIDFKSDGPWKAVVAASGVEALSRLEFSGQPRVRARGTLWRSPRETPSGESLLFPDLTFEISDREDECHLKSLVLSDFRFAGTLLGSDLKLDSLSGDFAGGVFTGRMALRDWNRPAMREQQLTLQLFDADYQTALRQLAGLLREPDRLEDALLHGDTRGRLDAAVDMSFGSDLDEAEGSGQITLRRANISRIHLFGGLSRLLDDIGLGFSTVNLNAASIQWRLADNRLGIKEGLVTGPVVSLRAEGEINLKSRLLNLDADLMLLQGLISKVLTPVSDTIELKVTGPIEEPVWRMNLTPLRWFQNRLSSDSRNNNER
ncbi:MAG: AsmA-like C-terminal region-containing protein, partial [Oceanipulchritudo sp.]